MADGWKADEVFGGVNGHALDEVVFLPGPNSSTDLQVDLSTKITRNVEMRFPFVSGPSATVTEANMAIAMALQGGIGILHRNMSIEEQKAMVRTVKTYSTGFILQCQTLKPWSTVADGLRVQAEHDCSCIPITDNGRVGGKLMGIVTRRDLEASDDRTVPLKAVMQRDVAFVREPVAIKQAREVMARSKVSKLPVVNKDKELVALICRGDIKREWDHPHASRDANRSLMVAAAVNPMDDDAWERLEALVHGGIDILCVDCDDGVFPDTVHFVKRVKDRYEGLDVLVGRVSSWRQAKDLCDAGVDGIRVGFGSQTDATTLYEVARLARNEPYQIPVLADCEASDVGTVLKVLCLGATSATLDGMLRGAEEAPGDHFYDQGARVKLSHGQAAGGTQPLVRLGTHGPAIVRGPVSGLLPRLLEGLHVGFRELGLSCFLDVPPALANGDLRMERQLRRDSAEKAAEHPPMQRVAVSTLHCRW